MALAALLGWSLLAAILLPAAPVPAADPGHGFSQASSPFGEWLADELRNRPGLRVNNWSTASSNDEDEDSRDPLAFLRIVGIAQASATRSHLHRADFHRALNPRTSPSSPRAPPASA